MLRRLGSFNYRVNRRLCLYISGWLILMITGLMVVDAIRRTLFALTIQGAIDVVEISMAWIVFIAFAYALITGAHVRMTLLVGRLPPRVRPGFEIFSSILGAAFFGLFTYLASLYFWTSWLVKETPMSPVPAPVWLAKAALPIGGVLIFLSFLLRLIRSLRVTREVIEAEEEIKGF